MRGATCPLMNQLHDSFISTHTPHAGRDTVFVGRCENGMHFNSHAPCGARRDDMDVRKSLVDFNSHAPCGARLCHARHCALKLISTHTPHAGRDFPGASLMVCRMISTHTPHAGRDCGCRSACQPLHDFNSHAPCGARQAEWVAWRFRIYFNSHAPCGARLTPRSLHML